MKKTLFLSMLLTAAVFCVFAQSGKISELSGEVELKRAGASNFVRAKAGDVIAADTIVSTGFKSTAIIEVGNSTIAVRALTRLSLAEIQSTADTETLNVKLQTGRVKVDVKPPVGTKANFTVQGPSSTASVRGTSFEIDALNLKVLEGTVAFRGSKGGELLIPAGMASYVDGDGRAIDPVGAATVSTAKAVRNPPASGFGYIKIVE